MPVSQGRVPFVAALEPWRAAARRELAGLAPEAGRVLTPAALDGLLAGLDDELGFVAAPSLLDAFRRAPLRRHFTRHTHDDADVFEAALVAGGLDDVAADVPALGTVLDLVVDDWCERAVSFVRRLSRDAPVLRDRFGLRLPVATVRPVIRTTIEVGDEHGPVVVYKDRSVGMDRAFAALVTWLDGLSRDRQLIAVDVVDRGDHGWMRHVPHGPVPDGDDRRAFRIRSGMLVCVAHLLGGGDLHAANIRCDGSHPVVVDAEVLLRPRRAGDEGPGDSAPSVLATGWLPVPGEVDRCGLAAEHFTGMARPWVDVGTDGVRPRPQSATRGRMRPEIVGSWAREADEIATDLCEGFHAAYALVRRHGLPLEVFTDTTPRVLLRTSRAYGDAIERSVTPGYLASTGRREDAFAWVHHDVPPALRDDAEVARRAGQAEQSSMRRIEIPRFHVPADGRTLHHGRETLGLPFAESPLERSARFLGSMGREAEAAQHEAIVDAVRRAASGSLDAVGVRFEALSAGDAPAWGW